MYAKVVPDFAANVRLNYYSDNERVVTVDKDGNFEAKKVGKANITICTEKGLLKEICQIIVTDSGEYSWDEQDFAEQKKNSFKVKANWIGKKKIKVKWMAQNAAKKYVVMRKDKKSKKFKKIATLSAKKTEFIDKKVKKNKNYWYKVICKNRKQETKSGIIKAKKNKKIILTVKESSKKCIKLSWNMPKGVSKIVILRKKQNGCFKELIRIARPKSQYKDKQISYFTEYTYKLLIIWDNNERSYSNVVSCTSVYKYDKEKNINYFKKNYPFVCTEEQKNMNDYWVFDEFYSPIKYKFTGDKLEIHLYLDFKKYVKNSKGIYIEKEASRTDGIKNESYINLFKQGLKKWYQINIVDDKYEFKGINFSTKVVIHDKSLEKYHPKQKFNEILIGGDSLNGWSTDSYKWYWTGTGGTGDTTFIYMPYVSQLKNNENESIRSIGGANSYKYTAAHEIGHSLGLDDGYISKYGYDRFTDNDETGYQYTKNMYDNLMVERGNDKSIKPNDLEMIFHAYACTFGRPWRQLESFKSYKYMNNGEWKIKEISGVIINKKDEFEEGE